MSPFGTPSKNPGENIELTKKISEITEIIPLTIQQVEEFKDVELSLNQISKLKEGKLTITELSRLKIEQLKFITAEFSNERLVTQLNKGAENSKQSVESAERILDKSIETIGNSTAGQKTKEALIVVKEKAKEVGSSAMFDKFIDNIKSSFSWLGGIFAGILSFFKGIIGFGEKAEELKEKLSAEEIEKTKKKLNNVGEEFVEQFNEKTGDSILPENREQLKKLLNEPNFFTEKELAIISEKIENGEFKLSDLSGINEKKYKKINELLFSPEQKEYLKNNLANKAVDAIAKEYHIDLKQFDKDKKERLKNLFTNSGIDADFIQIAEKYEKGGFISYGEIFSGMLGTAFKAPLFAFELISIIPFTNLAGHIASGATELLELSNNENEENIILKKLKGLSEEQKDIVLGMMMRKGMFIFNIIDNISYNLSRTIAESIVGGKTSSIEGIKAIATNNYKTQSKLLDRMLGTLLQTQKLGENSIGNILRKNVDNLIEAGEKAKKISNIMNIINNGGNIKGHPYLKELGIKSTDIKEIKIELGTKIKEFQNDIYKSKNVAGAYKGLKENKFGLSKQHHLNQTIEAHSKNLNALGNEWDRALGNKTLGKVRFWEKISGMKEFLRFNQETRNLEIHATNLIDGAEKADKLKSLVSKSPALFGSLAGTAGIVLAIDSIGGINENKSGIEQLIDSAQYLIPTYGPLQVIFSQSGIQKGASLKDNFISTGEIAPMLFFLGMDVAFISKELTGSVGSGEWLRGLKNIGNYHVQVFKTPVDLAKASYHTIKGGVEYSKTPGKIDFKAQMYKKLNKIRKSGPAVKLFFKTHYGKIGLGGLALAWALSDNFIDSSSVSYRKEFEKAGFIKKDGSFDLEKISSNMNNEEKEAFLQYFIFDNTENIEFKVNGSSLDIISYNNTIQYETTLTYNNLDILKQMGFDTTNEDGITLKYIPEDK